MAIVAYDDLRTAVDLFSKILSRTQSGRYGQVRHYPRCQTEEPYILLSV
jgi:hypothetical protein